MGGANLVCLSLYMGSRKQVIRTSESSFVTLSDKQWICPMMYFWSPTFLIYNKEIFVVTKYSS